MMEVVVANKSGFFCYGSPRIYLRGELFYYHKGNEKGKFYFNLPKGIYQSEGEIYKLKKPIVKHLPKLPKREVFYKIPKKVKVIITKNKNKCSIDLRKNTIYLDPEISKKGYSELTFVLFHEIGHYYYKTEEKCDLFAARKMLEMGFNPSQCGLSINNTLSDYSQERKKCLIKNLK
jgi:hypothetical protein